MWDTRNSDQTWALPGRTHVRKLRVRRFPPCYPVVVFASSLAIALSCNLLIKQASKLLHNVVAFRLRTKESKNEREIGTHNFQFLGGFSVSFMHPKPSFAEDTVAISRWQPPGKHHQNLCIAHTEVLAGQTDKNSSNNQKKNSQRDKTRREKERGREVG